MSEDLYSYLFVIRETGGWSISCDRYSLTAGYRLRYGGRP